MDIGSITSIFNVVFAEQVCGGYYYGAQFVQGKYAKLKVVEVPESATDFTLDEYDGWERIIYVVDGKLNFV